MNVKKMANNKGFTLVEMIVSIAVFALLISLSIWSVLAWEDHSNFIKLNEHSQEMYVTAQDEIVDMYSRNILEDRLFDKLQQSNMVDLSNLKNDFGKSYDIDSDVFYIQCFKGDYDLYMKGKKTKSDTAELVFMLLEDCRYDAEIFNNVICIELCPETRSIVAVLYSDDYESFSYGEGNTGFNITNREYNYRSENQIGYYGIED